MPRVQGYEQGDLPNTESRVDYQPNSIASGIAELGKGVGELGQTIHKRALDVAKAQADLSVTNNAVAQEIAISSMKKSVDLTSPDAFNEVMKPFDEANKQLLDSTDNEEVRSHITNTVADHRARYVQMLISRNAKLQNQDFLASKDKTVNLLAESTQNNPGLLADNLEKANSIFEGMSEMGIADGTIDRAREATKLKLNQSAADGKITSNPMEAKKAISEGQFELGDKRDYFLKKADTAIEAQKTRLASNTKRLKAVVVEQQRHNFNQDSLRISQNDPTVFDDIQKAITEGDTPTSRYSGAQLRILMNNANQRIHHDGKDDPTASRQAEVYLRQNEGDFEGAFSRYGNNISSATMKRLVDTHSIPRGASADNRSEFRSLEDAAYKAQVHPGISPFGDRQGLTTYGDTMNRINETYAAEVKAGTPTSELFDKSGKGKSLYRLITPATRAEVQQKRVDAHVNINAPTQTVSATGADNPQTPKQAPQLNEKQNAALQKIMSGMPKPEGRQ